MTSSEKAALKRQLKRALSDALRELRTQQEGKSSQEALANEIGMDRSYWGDIERGERNVTLFSLWQLARGLEIAPSRLVLAIDKHYRRLQATEAEPPEKGPLFRKEIEQLRKWADESPIMIWISGTKRNCLHVNRHVLEYTGRTLAEIQGGGWMDDVHPDDRERHMAVNHKAFAARMPYRDQYRYRKASGEYGWVAQEAVPQFTSKGVFLGFMGSLIPIGEPAFPPLAPKRKKNKR